LTDQDDASLAAQIGAALVRAAEHRKALVKSRLEALQARQAAVVGALMPEPSKLDELRLSVEQLAAQAERQRAEIADHERQLAQLRDRQEDLSRQAEQADGALRERCASLIPGLPVLSRQGEAQWISWIEGRLVEAGLAFEPAADWREELDFRELDEKALALLAPLCGTIADLEVASSDLAVARASLPAAIQREQEALDRLTADLSLRASQAGSRYGRILEDLPQPPAEDSPERLEQIEGILTYVEATLGRFAVSALLEEQMLEALQS
jgi:hypothetical protein